MIAAETSPAPGAVTDGPVPVTVVANDVAKTGGMERQLVGLLEGLLDSGHDITVISRSCDLSHPNLKWLHVPGPSRPATVAGPMFLVLASVLLRFHRKGIVHATGAQVLNRVDVSTVQYCHRGASHAGVPLRARRPTFGYKINARLAAWLARLTERWCFRPSRTRHLVAVSEGIATELREHFPDMTGRISVIPNAVELEPPIPEARGQVRDGLGVDPKNLVALFVGGDWERKGVRFVMEALAEARGWSLVIVGDGEPGVYGDLLSRPEIDGRVHFAGWTPDVTPFRAAADAFVFPTAYEAFPVAALEAAAAGLPLLATPVNGVTELIADGENGWFIERDAGSIARRLRALEEDEALRRRMGGAAREAAGRYNWPTVVEQYRALYRALVESAA